MIKGILKGTAIKSISHKDIQELPIPKIDLQVQRKIADKIKYSKEDYERRIQEALRIFNQEQEEIKKYLNFSIE